MNTSRRSVDTSALLAAARKFAELGFSLIPVKPMSKIPDLSRWQQYQSRRPGPEEIQGWFSKARNIGVVCGEVSGGLMVLDFDDRRAFRYFFRDWKSLAQRTAVVETAKGVHVYARLRGGGKPKGSSHHRKGQEKTWFPLDVKGEGGYVVAPPSVHSSGASYRFMDEFSGIMEVQNEHIEDQITKRSQEWPLVESMLSAWTAGNRHNMALGFAKVLHFRCGFDENRVVEIMERLCSAANDEEVADRVTAVRTTLSKGPEETAAREWLGDELYGKLVSLTPRVSKGRKPKTEKNQDGEEVQLETFMELPDGRIAEEILCEDGERFLLYDPTTDSGMIVTEIKVNGLRFRPRPIPIELREALTLADGIEEYSTTSELLKEMEKMALEIYDPVKEGAIFRMWVRGALSSWILGPMFEKRLEKFASLFRITGPSESGKGRALTVCRNLFHRPLYFLKTTKVPSLFRAIDPWQGTLILDEADLSDSNETADFVQFLNARATGSTIPRYSTEIDDNRYFTSFGNTVLATRKAYNDDGLNSRTVPLSAEATTDPDNFPLIPSEEWARKCKPLQRKLLLWRLRMIARIRRGEVALPSTLAIPGIRSFRVREAFLVLASLKEEPQLVDDMASIAKELEARLIIERSISAEGLILNTVYNALDDGSWKVKPDGIAFHLEQEYETQSGDERINEVRPLTLKSVSEALNKAFSSSEISRYWRALGQTVKDRDRFGKRLWRGVLLISNPKRLDREFAKFVVDAQKQVSKFSTIPLIDTDRPEQAEQAEQTTGLPPESVPPVPPVPPDLCLQGGYDPKNIDPLVRHETPPLSEGRSVPSTDANSDTEGKLADIEEKLLEEVKRQEAQLKTVFKESWPYVSALVEDCRDAIERGDRWGAYQIRAFTERFNPNPSSTVSELLANDEKGWQKTIKFIASARLIKGRKGDAP